MHKDNQEKEQNSILSKFSKTKNGKGLRSGLKATKDILKESGFELLEAGLSIIGLGGLAPLLRAGEKIVKREVLKNKAMQELERTVFEPEEGKKHKDIIESTYDKLSAFIEANALDPKEDNIMRMEKAISSSQFKGGFVKNAITYENLKGIINPERALKETKEKPKIPETIQLTLPFGDNHHTY
jgi:hypothetical protein